LMPKHIPAHTQDFSLLKGLWQSQSCRQTPV
jgi:hypothetical protein